MNADPMTLLAVFSFCFGAVIASFLNVVIWRVPRGESIVSPPSHCPKCGAAIRWYQNVPIVSWLALRGRCAACRAPISPRYILIEALGGCLFLAVFLKYGGAAALSWTGLVRLLTVWTWVALMIVGSAIDYDLKLLPDFVTVGGMVLGVLDAAALSAFNFSVFAAKPLLWRLAPLLHSLSGLAFGFGLLGLIRLVGSKVFRREAMGMGDVLLMGAVGALFGPVAVLLTLILSSVFGSVAGLALIALAKTKFGRFLEIPYGPFICLGCLAWIFAGPEIVRWYLSLLG